MSLLHSMFMNSLRTVTDEEIQAGTLLDTHRYTENDLTYEQKVYRLVDKTIYVSTELVKDASIVELEAALTRAISEQRFEDAAKIRDQIKTIE